MECCLLTILVTLKPGYPCQPSSLEALDQFPVAGILEYLTFI
jgi:hypothetical protein